MDRNLRPSALLYFQPYLVALALPFAAAHGGLWCFSLVVFLFVVHPLLDLVAGDVPMTQTKAARRSLTANLALWAFPFVQAALLVWGIRYFASPFHTVVEKLGVLYTVGALSGAVGITIAHELIHRRGPWQRGLGLSILAGVSYLPFRLAHVYWHHRFVATPLDPTSAPKGVPLYRFWVISIHGTLRTGWKIEAEALEKKGRRPLCLANRMVQYALITTTLVALSAVLGGVPGAVFFVGQSLVAISLLETTNYIEHYGLRRAQRADGRYEPTSDRHSWDTARRFTNWYTFNLGHHAHHHQNPAVEYQDLRIGRHSPKLPAGYSALVLLAHVPPLWRRVMDPRLPEIAGSVDSRASAA